MLKRKSGQAGNDLSRKALGFPLYGEAYNKMADDLASHRYTKVTFAPLQVNERSEEDI